LDLPLWIARTPIAKRVGVKIQRDGEAMSLNLTVAELPQTQLTVGNQIG
jgi:S1-C subfamily serine protease